MAKMKMAIQRNLTKIQHLPAIPSVKSFLQTMQLLDPVIPVAKKMRILIWARNTRESVPSFVGVEIQENRLRY
jgi:hypothetical protein